MAKNKLSGTTLKVGGFLEEFEKDSIKESINIVELFSSYGIKLNKKGSSYVACCPWHDDKTPSLSVDKKKGLYNCFGCGESGDAFSLVMKMDNVDFQEAITILKQSKSIIRTNPAGEKPEPKGLDIEVIEEPITQEDPITQEEAEKVLDDAKKYSTDIDSLLKLIKDEYSIELTKSKKAQDYLRQRNIHDNAFVKKYSIGFSTGKLVERLNRDSINLLKDVGILTDKGQEFFKGCIIFPLTDQYHNVVGFYGRDTNERSKFKHRYLKGEHKGLFNIEAVKIFSDEIILTESVIDGLSLQKLGFNNTIPCYGTNGFSDAHLKTFKDNLVKKITIAFDSDEVGITASKKLKDKLYKEGFEVKEISPPKGNDWNEYLIQGGTKEEIEDLLKIITYEGKNKKPFSVDSKDSKYTFTFDEITYRVTGVKETFVSNLRVNIKAETEERNYIDNVDLYSARSRIGYIDRLSNTLGLKSSKVEKEVLLIIEHLEHIRDKAFEDEESEPEIKLTDSDKELGLKFLKNPNMFDEIVEDTEVLGYVGEALNKQLIYLAASSRLLDDPISVTVISESASGKSYLIDTIKKLIPEEDVISFTTLSDQALNYLPDDALINKFLVMGEAVHSDIIDHQIREMLSSKELSRMVTTKDDKTGKMTTKTVRKDVVVSTVMSSTNTDINPENASRVFVINTDESVEQTKRIHSVQRQKYSLERYKKKVETVPDIIRKHKSAQRMLRNLLIVNNFVEHLTFPDSLMRTRRDHERFIDLISTVCFLRQYQKEIQTEVIDNEKVEYIVCDIEDYRIAREIMVSILSATLVNLPKSALSLYEDIRTLAREMADKQGINIVDVELTQREIREICGLPQMFVKRNIKELAEYEYIRKSSYSRGKKGSYRLIKDEDIKLIDHSLIPTVGDMEKTIQG